MHEYEERISNLVPARARLAKHPKISFSSQKDYCARISRLEHEEVMSGFNVLKGIKHLLRQKMAGTACMTRALLHLQEQ